MLATDTVNGRILCVIKSIGITQSDFANRIGIRQSSVSQICSGKSGVSDRTISDICRVFGVDEIWLKTGVGEMFRPKSQKEELAEIFAQVLDSDDARARMVGAFSMLPEDAYPALERAILQIADRLRKE